MTLVFLMVEPKIIELKVNEKYLTLVGSNHGKFSGSKCGESDFLKRKYFHEGFTGKVSYERYKKDHPFEGYIDYLNNMGEFYFKIAHGINDWRNVVIAKGLVEKISQLSAENIVAIHGAQHTRPIAFYINNPELRQQKFEGYKRFNEVGRQGIKKFTPVFDINNMDKCIWKRELILPDAHTIVVKRI